MKHINCTNCNKEFPLVRTFADVDKLFGVCSHCGASVFTDEEVELSDEQAKRCDEVYEAVLEMCKELVEDPDLEYDMAFIGEITEFAANTLIKFGNKVHFPAVVTDQDGSQHIEEYYMSDNQ